MIRQYITPEDIERARREIPVRWGPLGKPVYQRTYSRIKPDGTHEDWYETCARVVNGNCSFVDERFIEPDEPRKLYEMMVKMKVIPGGRHLHVTGALSDAVFLANCHCSDFTDRFSEHFEYTFSRLMEGGGVGANYSNLFINSRQGNKPWVPLRKVNVHILLPPDYPDLHNENNEIDLVEEPDVSLLDPEYRIEHIDPALVLTQETRKPSGKIARRYYTTLELLRSRKYSHEWAGNGLKLDTGVHGSGRGKRVEQVLDDLYRMIASYKGSGIYVQVDDSREGWALALSVLLESFVAPDGPAEIDLVFDLSQVRPAGSRLKSFGGKASGPGALSLMLVMVSNLLNGKVGERLGSLDMMTIDHYIARCVVAGGSRRSARMSMKYWQDPDIMEFIRCKAWSNKRPMSHWTTNISVVVDNKFIRAARRKNPHALEVLRAVVEGMLTVSEPGLINASKCLEGEAPGTVFFSTNPCGEIAFVRYPDMPAFDICTLGHVNLPYIENEQEMLEAFRLMTRFLIRSTFAPQANHRTTESIRRNRRIGVGFLGYHTWLALNGIKFSVAPESEFVRTSLKRWYDVVQSEARRYASELRIPEPIKKTAVAPTGTIGQLPGVSTGIQPVFAPFYIRRVRYSGRDELMLRRRALQILMDKDSGLAVLRDRRDLLDRLNAGESPEVIHQEVKQLLPDLGVDEPLVTTTLLRMVIEGVELTAEDDELLRIKVLRSPNEPDTLIAEYLSIDSTMWLVQQHIAKANPDWSEEEVQAAALDLIETQYELSPQAFLANQKMVQDLYADNAISITINVKPEQVKPEELMQMLLEYLPSLKGVTVAAEYSLPLAPYEAIGVERFEEMVESGYPVSGWTSGEECATGACPI